MLVRTSVMLSAVLGASLLVIGSASAQDATRPKVRTSDALGAVMVDGQKGLTLYRYRKDAKDKIACTGECEKAWIPVLVGPNSSGDNSYAILTRPDGKKQWVYKDKPVYTSVKDTKADTAAGQAVTDWEVVRP